MLFCLWFSKVIQTHLDNNNIILQPFSFEGARTVFLIRELKVVNTYAEIYGRGLVVLPLKEKDIFRPYQTKGREMLQIPLPTNNTKAYVSQL